MSDATGIIKKLLAIQTELKAPKGQYNAFGKYKYRSCEDIVESVKPLAKKMGVLLTISDEMVYIGERYYIKATATLYDTDSGNSINVCGYAREEKSLKGMQESQITGATSSYARKYALNGLFAIDDSKTGPTPDPDALPPQKNQTQTDSQAQLKKLYNKAAAKGFTIDDVTSIAKAKFKQMPNALDSDKINKLLDLIDNETETLKKWLDEKKGINN